jgi:hypothetical protein
MNDDPNQAGKSDRFPIRYGITPVALIGLGWVLMIGVALVASGLFRLVTWLFR